MTPLPRVLFTMRRRYLPIVLASLVTLTGTSYAGQVRAAIAPAPVAVPAVDAAALAAFQTRLNDYLKLREDLGRKLRPLSITPDSAELTTRQESLAAAIRTVRKNAKPGDLIPPAVAKHLAATVLADFHIRNAQVAQAVFEDVPNITARPVINKLYPENEALPTMPPLLLGKLPQLPDNLQYRFFGRSVVILDGDTEIIIDYVPNVLPPH